MKRTENASDRDRWAELLANELMSVFPTEGLSALQRATEGLAAQERAMPALLAVLAERYFSGRAPDELAENVASATPGSLPTGEALDAVVLPATQYIRLSCLPGEVWWRPVEVGHELLLHWARVADVHSDDLGALVQERFFQAPEIGRVLVDRLGPAVPAVPTLVDHDIDSEVATAIDTYIAKNPRLGALLRDGECRPLLMRRPDIQRRLGFCRVVVELLKKSEELGVEQSRLQAYLQRYLPWLQADLTPLEQQISAQRSSNELALIDALDQCRKLVIVEGESQAPMMDMIGGRVNAPLSVEKHWRGAGQLLQRRVGLISNWVMKFEEVAPPAFRAGGVPQIELGVRDEEALVPLTIAWRDDSGHLMGLPVEYSSCLYGDVLSAGILGLTGRARIDMATLTAQRAFSYVGSMCVPVPEDVARDVLARAADLNREMLAGGQPPLELLHQSLAPGPESPTLGLLAMEAGVMESLGIAGNPSAILGPRFHSRRSDAQIVDALASRRTQLLEAHAERIRLGNDRLDDVVRSLTADYYEAVQDARTEAGIGTLEPAVDDAVTRLTDHAAAVLGPVDGHLHIVEMGNRRYAYEMMSNGQVGHLLLEDEFWDTLIESFPERPSPGGLDALQSDAAHQTGDWLLAWATERGVRRVYLAVSGKCHRIPFHALSASDGRFVSDVIEISYVPALSLISSEVRSSNDVQPGLFVGHRLPHMTDECAVVSGLRMCDTLSADQATARAVRDSVEQRGWLHLCLHGNHLAEDYLGSSFTVSDGRFGDDVLPLASLLALDLQGLEYVVAASCWSGANVPVPDTFLDVPSGIDSALLAAGVRVVVSSLWPINDLSGLVFSAALHLSISEGASLFVAWMDAVVVLRDFDRDLFPLTDVGQALARCGVDWPASLARMDTICGSPVDFRDPYYWACFRYAGSFD